MNVLRELWARLGTSRKLGLLVVVGAAVVVRVALFALEGVRGEEPRTLEIAQTLLEQGRMTYCNEYFPFCTERSPTAQVGPLPTLLFAALLASGDSALYLIVWLQQILGVLTCVGVYALALALYDDRRVACVSGLLAASYPHLARLELFPREETLFALLTVLGCVIACKAWKSGRRALWLGAGATFAAASLCRPALLYFGPILALATLAAAPDRFARRTGHAVALLVGFVVVLSPWVVRNQSAFDAFVPGGTLTGYNLYRHNHIVSGDDYLRYVRGDEGKAAIAALVARRTDLRGDENEAEMDRVYRDEAVARISEHPGRYALLALYRFAPLFTDFGVSPDPLPLFWRAVALANLALVLLAVLAVLARMRRDPFARWAVLLIPVLLLGYYTAGHMLANAKLRYAVPIMPLFMVLATDLGVRALDRWLGTRPSPPSEASPSPHDPAVHERSLPARPDGKPGPRYASSSIDSSAEGWTRSFV